MRADRIALLVAMATLGLAACLFPSFDDFHQGADSTSSSSDTGSGAGSSTASTSPGTGGTGGAGASGGGGGGGNDPRCNLSDDPVAVWPLDDGPGHAKVRECRDRYPGTIGADPDGGVAWMEGRDKRPAILFKNGFDAPNALISMTNTADLRIGGDAPHQGKPFTVTAWFHNTDGFNFPHFLVSRRPTWSFYVNGGGGSGAGFAPLILGTRMENLDGGAFNDQFSDEIPYQDWLHFAVTFDGTGTVKFYANGDLVSTKTFGDGGYAPEASGMRIGGSANGDNFSLSGGLSEVRVYDKELDGPAVANVFHF